MKTLGTLTGVPNIIRRTLETVRRIKPIEILILIYNLKYDVCINYELHYKVYRDCIDYKQFIIYLSPRAILLRFAIRNSQLFSLVYMLILLLLAPNMCLHPTIDRKLSNLYDKYHNTSLEEFDNCDYVHSVSDANQSDLVVMQLNIRGVSSKRAQLVDLLENSVQNKHVDIVLISETWLTSQSPDLKIAGYDVYRQDRTHKKGGGVAIVISSKLCCAERQDLSSKLEETECVTLEIKLKSGENCIVSSMYQPPNSDTSMFIASYNSLVCAMKKEKPKGIIIGLDHNLNFLKADKHHATNDFIQSNLDFGLIPTVTRPTRITNTSATLIDNIIVSQNLCGAYTSNILVNDTSDHLPSVCVLTSLVSAKKEPVMIKSRDTRVRNLLALKTEIKDYDWSRLVSDPCPSKNMDCVNTQLSDIIDRCIPYKERRINHRHLRREVWLTASIKLSIDRNKKLYAKMLKGECAKSKYSNYNKVLRKTIRFAKVQFYQNMCSEYKTHTKKLWGLINEISGNTQIKQVS